MRILILEDDPFIALDLQCIVEGEGHRASICGTVAEARRHLARGRPAESHPADARPADARPADDLDFALLDVDVTDGKSYDVACALAERRIPFVFVSGSKPGELPAALRDARFISKPFLEETIVAALPRAGTGAVRVHAFPRPAAADERPAA
ncbi:MAG TPA: response regulator [Beijerinckiaceae bacterium]